MSESGLGFVCTGVVARSIQVIRFNHFVLEVNKNIHNLLFLKFLARARVAVLLMSQSVVESAGSVLLDKACRKVLARLVWLSSGQ